MLTYWMSIDVTEGQIVANSGLPHVPFTLGAFI